MQKNIVTTFGSICISEQVFSIIKIGKEILLPAMLLTFPTQVQNRSDKIIENNQKERCEKGVTIKYKDRLNFATDWVEEKNSVKIKVI